MAELKDMVMFVRHVEENKIIRYEASMQLKVETRISPDILDQIGEDMVKELVADQTEKIFKEMLKHDFGKISPNSIPSK